jgi:hypothetical protein
MLMRMQDDVYELLLMSFQAGWPIKSVQLGTSSLW